MSEKKIFRSGWDVSSPPPPMAAQRYSFAADSAFEGIQQLAISTPSTAPKAPPKAVAKSPPLLPINHPQTPLPSNLRKTVLLLCTNSPSLKVERKKRKTGLWLDELATPYYTLLANNMVPIIVSPNGGAIPIDSGSLAPDFFSKNAKKFLHDREAMHQFSHSVRVKRLVGSCSADAIFICGGHGFADSDFAHQDVKALIEELDEKQKVIAAISHGALALCQCVKTDGSPLVEGRRVTGFSNSEEEAVGMERIVPYLIQTRMEQQNASYSKARGWSSYVVVDENLVTAQNLQSSQEVATALVTVLKGGV